MSNTSSTNFLHLLSSTMSALVEGFRSVSADFHLHPCQRLKSRAHISLKQTPFNSPLFRRRLVCMTSVASTFRVSRSTEPPSGLTVPKYFTTTAFSSASQVAGQPALFVFPCMAMESAQLQRVDRGGGQELPPYLTTQALRPFCRKNKEAASLCLSSHDAHGLPRYPPLACRAAGCGTTAFRCAASTSILASGAVLRITNLSMVLWC